MANQSYILSRPGGETGAGRVVHSGLSAWLTAARMGSLQQGLPEMPAVPRFGGATRSGPRSSNAGTQSGPTRSADPAASTGRRSSYPNQWGLPVWSILFQPA